MWLLCFQAFYFVVCLLVRPSVSQQFHFNVRDDFVSISVSRRSRVCKYVCLFDVGMLFFVAVHSRMISTPMFLLGRNKNVVLFRAYCLLWLIEYSNVGIVTCVRTQIFNVYSVLRDSVEESEFSINEQKQLNIRCAFGQCCHFRE